MKLGSLFSGIGGFELAGPRHGFMPVFSSEIEPFPIRVTKIHFPGMAHLGDITKINGAEIEPVDVITGGSPCQELSVAGKRAGLAGKRSGLYMEQIRIVKEMRIATSGKYPRFMVWENVPGAFSSNGGEDFRAVLEEAASVADETVAIPRPANDKWFTAGHIVGNGFNLAWKILDAQHFGVPQRRRRIFLVADFNSGGNTTAEILFKREGLRGNPSQSGEAWQGAAGDAAGSAGAAICLNDQGGSVMAFGIGEQPNISHCLQGNGIGRADTAKVFGICSVASNSMLSSNPHSGIYEAETSRTLDHNGGSPACNQGGMAIVQAIDCRNHRVQGISGTLQSKAQGQNLNYINPVVCMAHGQANAEIIQEVCPTLNCNHEQPIAFAQNQRDEVRNLSDCAGALAAEPGAHQQTYVSSDYAVRRLTPLEAERLQGFPDFWTDVPGASDSARYKALGNSVAIPCVEYVMEGIAEVLKCE